MALFNGKILQNVSFSISGYKNPERENIRNKAIELGATYERNLSKETTHLM